jgi:hypothetical protein
MSRAAPRRDQEPGETLEREDTFHFGMSSPEPLDSHPDGAEWDAVTARVEKARTRVP